ncbi:MAG: hypothetical protein R2706_12425 [Acidimicrobiales bacterium]
MTRTADADEIATAPTPEPPASPRGGGGVSFVAAMALSNVGNFLFHTVASRRLGPASYGALASTLGIMLALALPTAAIQVSVTRSAAKLFARGGDYTIRPFVRRGLTGSLALSACIALSAPVIANSLRLDSAGAVLWVAAFAPAAFLSTIGRGILMAEARFGRLATIVLATTATRVGAAWLLLQPGDTETKAMMLTVMVEYVLALALSTSIASRLGHCARRVRVGAADLTTSSIAFAGLWVLLAADLVIARRILTPEQAGLYAAAAMGGRAALFLPQAIAQIAHARLAAAADASEGQRIIRASVLASVAFAIANVAGMAILGPWLVVVGFGADYAPDRSLVVALTISASVLALGNLAMHLRLALGRGSARSWLGLVIVAVLAVAIPATPLALAIATIAAGTALVASLSRPISVRPQTVQTRAPSSTVSTLDVSIVVPYRADTPGSIEVFRSITTAAARAGWDYEIIAVSRDGSVAKRALIQRISGGRADHVSCLPGRGLADAQSALRLGATSSRGRNVVFFDPETGIDPATIVRFVELRDFYDCDAVVGSKRHPESTTNYPAIRRLASWGYQQLLQLLFQVKVKDCQVSCKVFSQETVRDVIPLTTSSGLAFELEMLVIASRTQHRRLVEAPVSTTHRFSSLIDVGSGLGMVMATLRLRATLNSQLDRGPATTAPTVGSGAVA